MCRQAERLLQLRGPALAEHKNKAAFIFVPEPEQEAPQVITYRELYVRVNETAAMLRGFAGLKAGDRVTIHMPMIPELPITMLACARLGVVHSVVFGGFSGEACGLRAADSGSRVLIYADGYWRNGKWIDHKGNADIAIETARKKARKSTRCWSGAGIRARPSEAPMVMGRDFWWKKLCELALQTVGGFAGCGRAAIFNVYQRHDGETRAASTDWRLPGVRDRNVEILPGHSSGRCVLVHGGHRLDHRALVHRVWAARVGGDQRVV